MEREPADREPDESSSLERLAWRNPGVLTLAIMAACVAVAFVTLRDEPGLRMARLIDWGAKVNANIAAGEWWRLLTAAFLHGSWQHLIFNLYALFVVGSLVERVLGHARFLVIYVVSAIAGSLASYALDSHVAVGASGAIFGLFGAALVASRIRPQDWTLLTPKHWSGLALWAGYNLAAGLMQPGVDNAAHLGGLVGGVAALLFTAVQPLRPVLAAVSAIALGWSGYQVVRSAKVTPLLEAFNRGIAATEHHDLKVAEKEFGAAVPFGPALVNRSLTRIQLGDYSGALADADAALADLDGEPVRHGAPAPLALRTYARNFPTARHQAHLDRATALYGLGRDSEAVAAADDALVTHNEEAYERTRYVRGLALARLGRISEALPDFEQAMTSSDSGVRTGAVRAWQALQDAIGPIRLRRIRDSTAVRLSRAYTEAELDRVPEILACYGRYDGVARPGGYVELHFVVDHAGFVMSQTVRIGRVQFGGSTELATKYLLSCRYRPGLVRGLPVDTQWHQGFGPTPPVPDTKLQ